MLLLYQCTDESLKILIGLVKTILGIIQIAIPIILIVWGTIDLGKAVIASDEKAIKTSQQTLIKRAIAAALVFVLAVIVGFLMGVVGNQDWKDCWNQGTVCPEGIDTLTGTCKCESNKVYNSQTNKCECESGKNWDGTEKVCK